MTRFGNAQSVSRSTGICSISGEALSPGTKAVAALCEREDDEGFDRIDFSETAWEDSSTPDRLFSHWRYRVPDKGEKEDIVIDDEVLLDLFERLDGDERPQRVAFRYILALVLLRKRKLQLVSRDQDEAGELWNLKFRGTDCDPVVVRNPGIKEDEIQDLSDQLGEILQGDF